ncbi:DUF2591 domain-containing protein [Proteus vulgaris]|uniref:DUF2591 domain-containing protein n=1 Tax=Proteus vulgaris TaxID=585 RepID=UPI0021B1054D|nr:DUF2591 domain-containing protein [Proteus vulgaris]MCT6517537.1 DUF2591 domain-containing protein [Proteus vulgaris]
MNKYTELSDFEIDLLVAQLIFSNDEYDVIKQSMEVVKFQNGSGKGVCYEFNPCNNPTDAMQIIIENLISLMPDMSYDGGSTWWCASDISNGITSRYKSNPLRAAM